MTTSRIHSIPAEGLRHESGNVVVTAIQTPQAGCLVQVRIDGRTARDLCSGHNHQGGAIAEYNRLVEQYPAPVEVEVVEPAPVRLQPAAKGTTTFMSAAQFEIIGQAIESTGTIRRGRGYAAADIRQLYAMRDARFVTLDHPIRARIGTVTAKGRKRYAEIAAEHAEVAERAAAIAHVLAYAAA